MAPLWMAMDTETTGLELRDGASPFIVTTCTSEGLNQIWEWPVDPLTREVQPDPKDLREIQSLLESYTAVFHNAIFDIFALSNLGIRVYDFEDTLLSAHIFNSAESHGLKELCLKYFDFDPRDESVMRKFIISARLQAKKLGWNRHSEVMADAWMPAALVRRKIPSWAAAAKAVRTYAMNDAFRVALLWEAHCRAMRGDDCFKRCYQREKTLLPIVMSMQDHGITVSTTRLASEIDRYKTVMGGLLEEAQSVATGVNLNSGKQLGVFLFETLTALRSPDRTPSGGYATHKAALTRVVNETKNPKARLLCEKLLLARKYKTSIAYLEGYVEAVSVKEGSEYGSLYYSLNQVGTSTTRFSSSNPNAQNIGKGSSIEDESGEHNDFQLRYVFGPRTDEIWYCIDYDQLQLRIFASLAQDKKLLSAFERGLDIHGFVAESMFGKDYTPQQRRIAKNLNFGIIFGAGKARIAELTGSDDAYDLFCQSFSRVHEYISETIGIVRSRGFVRTVFGYPLTVEGDRPYKGANYCVQGFEGDMVKNAMIECHQFLSTLTIRPRPRMILVVHDELIFRFPARKDPDHWCREVRTLQNLMEQAGLNLGVYTPTSLSVVHPGTGWSEAEEWMLPTEG